MVKLQKRKQEKGKYFMDVVIIQNVILHLGMNQLMKNVQSVKIFLLEKIKKLNVQYVIMKDSKQIVNCLFLW